MKNKYLMYFIGAGCLIIIMVLFVGVGGAFGITMLNNTLNGGSSSSSSSPAGTGSIGSGEQKEFVLTHYTPCTPEYKAAHPGCDPKMQGDSGTANGGKAVYDETSPMGFYVNYKGKRYDYAGAVPWHNTNPILPFVTPGTQPKTGVTFDDPSRVFVALDHFGSCANNPKAIDILASTDKYNDFFSNLKKAGLVTGQTEKNGCSSSLKPVVKGTLGEIIKAGTTGAP